MVWDWQVTQTSLEKHPYLMLSVRNNGAGKIQGFPDSCAKNIDSLLKFCTSYFFLIRFISYYMEEKYDISGISGHFTMLFQVNIINTLATKYFLQ